MRRRITRERQGERKRELVRRYGAQCRECGRRLPAKELQVDHIQPRSLGGGDELENTQLLCEPCHRDKDNWVGEARSAARPYYQDVHGPITGHKKQPRPRTRKRRRRC